MKIQEKQYIKRCSCGTNIIYTQSELPYFFSGGSYFNELTCPSCHRTYSSLIKDELFEREYIKEENNKDVEFKKLKQKIEDAIHGINNKLASNYNNEIELFNFLYELKDTLEQ